MRSTPPDTWYRLYLHEEHDFIITNVGTNPIALLPSTDENLGGTEILALWLTSDAVKDPYVDLKTGLPLSLVVRIVWPNPRY